MSKLLPSTALWILAALPLSLSGCGGAEDATKAPVGNGAADTQSRQVDAPESSAVEQNDRVSIDQHNTTTEKADEPVYQGRAVFKEAVRPEFPKAFRGNWELQRGQCAADNDAMIVRVDSQGYRAGDGAMSIKKTYLAPGDQKRLIIDAIYSGGGEDVEQTVIVQMNDDEAEFRVWNKGEPEASATIFYRCKGLRG